MEDHDKKEEHIVFTPVADERLNESNYGMHLKLKCPLTTELIMSVKFKDILHLNKIPHVQCHWESCLGKYAEMMSIIKAITVIGLGLLLSQCLQF
jgi:hypothetical protein